MCICDRTNNIILVQSISKMMVSRIEFTVLVYIELRTCTGGISRLISGVDKWDYETIITSVYIVFT